MTAIHLGIDVGGTASRWVACNDAGIIVARGSTSGATGHLFNPAEKDRLKLSLANIGHNLLAQDLVPKTVTTGLTGFGSVVANTLLDLLGDAYAVSRADCITVDDMTLAYASIFAPGEGHLISSGTGSIGLHIGHGDTYVRVGGRGILIDDAGSGSWIALKALDTLFRHLDHNGSIDGVSILADELSKMLGGIDWHVVREFVYGGDRGRIGTLSTAVGKAADRGDPTAASILEDAGRELVRMAEALTNRVGPKPVGFIGGVLMLSRIRPAIEAALPGKDLRFPQTDAALAAAQMQTGQKEDWLAVLKNNRGLK
ncbi:hypothetical protein VW35_01210 [Devosia soli]|uniref:ATPase BadF/BadG/BcrA/BcrD type domain-containing protein n=1 Tax=Devosia soli TaxID=361041 RepID=A0A0F5LF69_9HYPH|nr:BadF/BadG/BcrA/BcrD ATPase family protein [Devosia soli]KKB80849.1 hypothetical protein VW35_01210 [Devosia soli]